ncbi:MAG TPA: short-chain dehydrogenase [Chloroflexi bacterium]|nr:short-chain dehydrogenase [Chloroflexota bacterium]|tara:strand:+ start:905 stop:1681 length:777 start_codon:yes stop_codon:yes gene_type:complete
MILKNKVALITGGATGIGRSTAVLLSQKGAKLVIADVSDEGNNTAEEICNSGGEAVFVKGDVSIVSDVTNIVSVVANTYGRLDILHNNAGVLRISDDVSTTNELDWDLTINVNLKGVFLVSKYSIPLLKNNGGGAIVNTASMAGWSVGMAGLAAYCASKAGVVGLTKCMSIELAKYNIRVNCICPGTIDTSLYTTQFLHAGGTQQELDDDQKSLSSLIPQGRYGTPEEIAKAVLYLCSSESSYVNGQALVVDGGFSNQ